MKKVIAGLFIFLTATASLAWAEGKVEVFTTVRYDQFIIYQSLAFLWVGIAGLLVIIRMKLQEIERVQKLGLDRKAEDEPYLE
ncbi:MAG: hypothetical protein QMD32_05905 [Smithellaceae bacterium]|nr:hypothetical protein [Smithellaceae bacterium]